ncbi:MAG: alkaline phosphatase family protein [Lachnospiraceae bacterium]|nr:alkaline phosphatase family protein [Lachnospiraceae bacterium]
MKKAEYCIVLSLDAVGSRDFEYLKELPNVKELLKTASYSTEVSSVYPSITYPAHTSIVTGHYPGTHGIVNNTKLQLRMDSPDWFWKRKAVQKKTLYEEAEKNGLKTAAILWPVTGGARISYNLPEILPNRPWQSQISVCMMNGSVLYELDLDRRFGYLREGVKQPQLDNFVQESMLYTIKRYKPQLMLVHMTDVDTNRHLYGVDSREAKEALERHDRRIGELTAVLKAEGIYDKTALFILGDHSQMDVHTAVYPNYWLKEKGLIETENGKIKSFLAYAHNCDGSCYIYVKKGLKEEERKRVVAAVMELKEAMPQAIERIYTRKEAQAMGADKSCACMLEAGAGYYFLDEMEQLTAAVDMESGLPHMMKGTHGYHPDKPGYQTIFIANGCGIRKNISIGEMSLVDEGPTIAALLGLSLGETAGRTIDILDADTSLC